MYLNSWFSFTFPFLFIISVRSIQNTFQQASSPPICSFPYMCIPTNECAERHAAQGTDEVLFQCEGKKKVCCPPLKTPFSSVPSVQGVSDIGSTTEQDSCAKCTFESVKPQNIGVNKHPIRKETKGNAQSFGAMTHQIYGADVHTQPAGTRPSQSQPPESRRPPQVQLSEERRPPQHQHLQTSSYGSRPQSSEPFQPSFSTHKNFRLLPSESHCGVNNFANRITEGEEVSLGEYPWMVLTGLKDKYGNYRWNCGGTLINGWYVLTAAHCLLVDNRTIQYVRLGEHSLTNETDCYRDVCSDPPEDIPIAEVLPHEKWNTTTIKNDIALLRLSRNPLTLGKSNIYPICLPLDAEKLNITWSTKYEVAGWGKTDWNADEGSDVLRKASISGVSREECNICKDKKKQQYCPITDTQLCVQGWKSVDVCKGDSGGPLMVTRLNIYQIGITSFKGSEYCGAENIPSIFTKGTFFGNTSGRGQDQSSTLARFVFITAILFS